jgi:hypothetical protein
MKVSVNGEIIIKFKHSETVDNAEDVLTSEEIKDNILEMTKRKLKDSLNEIEIDLVDCNIVKTIDN